MIAAKKEFPDAVIFYDILKVDNLDNDIAISEKYGFHALVANLNFLTPETVKKITGAGFIPGVWNINNPGDMDQFIAMGVKRFYTDFPSVLMKKLVF